MNDDGRRSSEAFGATSDFSGKCYPPSRRVGWKELESHGAQSDSGSERSLGSAVPVRGSRVRVVKSLSRVADFGASIVHFVAVRFFLTLSQLNARVNYRYTHELD